MKAVCQGADPRLCAPGKLLVTGALGGGVGGPRQCISRAELLAFALTLRATAGRELGYITHSATCSRKALCVVKGRRRLARRHWQPGPVSTSGAKFGNWKLGGNVELPKVESHIELEKVGGWGLCHGTHACIMEADKTAGKAALQVQVGVSIAEEVKDIEQEGTDMRRRLMAAMLDSAKADERGRRWAERQGCAPRPPID